MHTPESGPNGRPQLAEEIAGNLAASGGTWTDTQAQILSGQGVPAAEQAPTRENLAQAVGERRGVIANLDAARLWSNTSPGAWHAVTVIGAEYDASGNISAYIINDTGSNTQNCGVRVPAATMHSAMADHGGDIVVTDAPVW